MYIFYTCIEIYNHTLPDLTLSVYCTTLPYHTYNITLHYMMLHDTLHCVIALPYIPFHYLTLHDTTLQYIPQLFPEFFSYVPQLFHNSSTTVPIWTVDYIHLTFHTPKFLLPGRQLRQLLRWLRGWRWWRRSHG